MLSILNWLFQGNAVYNIMPDMVSRLSDPEVGVEEEHFKTIMKLVFKRFSYLMLQVQQLHDIMY